MGPAKSRTLIWSSKIWITQGPLISRVGYFSFFFFFWRGNDCGWKYQLMFLIHALQYFTRIEACKGAHCFPWMQMTHWHNYSVWQNRKCADSVPGVWLYPAFFHCSRIRNITSHTVQLLEDKTNRMCVKKFPIQHIWPSNVDQICPT